MVDDTGASLRIQAQVYGSESITQLETTLQRLKETALKYGDAKKLMTAQTRVEIQQMKMSNGMLKARANMKQGQMTQLAKQTVLEQQYQQQFNVRFQAEQNAYSLREMYKNEGIKITKKEAMAANMANTQIIAGEKAKRIAINETRKTLMAASISMFVLNISLGQLVQSIKPFVKGNEDAEKAVMDLQNALRFSMAPLQAYMALQMISTSLADGQKVAFMGVASALGAVFFWYQAITAKSAGMRAAYAAFAVVLTAVAVASWMVNFGLATTKALLGDITGIAAVVAGVAAMAGVVAYVTAPKAQTLTGRSKHVRKGGWALLDDDEDIMRRSKDGTKNGGGGGDINIYLPDSYMGTLSDAKITAQTVRRYTQTGQGSIQFKRKVASNG